MSTRRDFLERAATIAALSTFPIALDASPASATPMAADTWDLTWTKKITGKYKAVFDVPEIDSGYGVWRASIWANHYMETLKAAPRDLTSVVVMRHNGIFLAMQQSFWDKYGIGKEKAVKHPVTEEATDRNPVLLSSSRGEVPAQLDDVALDKYIARGGVALACNLAFDDVVGLVQKVGKVSAEEARKVALAGMVPGVILQPSGVFAALYAQDIGCKYLRAS